MIQTATLPHTAMSLLALGLPGESGSEAVAESSFSALLEAQIVLELDATVGTQPPVDVAVAANGAAAAPAKVAANGKPSGKVGGKILPDMALLAGLAARAKGETPGKAQEETPKVTAKFDTETQPEVTPPGRLPEDTGPVALTALIPESVSVPPAAAAPHITGQARPGPSLRPQARTPAIAGRSAPPKALPANVPAPVVLPAIAKLSPLAIPAQQVAARVQIPVVLRAMAEPPALTIPAPQAAALVPTPVVLPAIAELSPLAGPAPQVAATVTFTLAPTAPAVPQGEAAPVEMPASVRAMATPVALRLVGQVAKQPVGAGKPPAADAPASDKPQTPAGVERNAARLPLVTPATPTEATPLPAPTRSDMAAAPVAATAAPPSPAQHDFAALIDRLVEARQAAQVSLAPQTVSAAIQHAEFGRVSLQFRQDADGLSVVMAGNDPDLARAVQIAAPAAATGAQTGTFSEGNPPPRQDGAGQMQTQTQTQAQSQQQRGGTAQRFADETRPSANPSPRQRGADDPEQRSGIFA